MSDGGKMDERNRIVKERTQWFADCGWGIMCHWVPGGFSRYAENKEAPFAFSAEDWNRQVDAFDVGAFADQLADIGVPYIFFTVGHGTGYYCAPNATYDGFMQRQPSRCSRRDLIADLGHALSVCVKITSPSVRCNGVVPLRVGGVGLEMDLLHLRFGDLDAALIFSAV